MIQQLFIAALLLLGGANLCAQELYQFASPQDEARFKQLSEELRCLVCQNQNLADSHAELAGDLRQEVYEMVEKGQSNQQIKDFLVHRYGDFVLYRPPIKLSTILLWFGPFVGFFIAGFFIWRFIRKRSDRSDGAISEKDRAKLQQALKDADSRGGDQA